MCSSLNFELVERDQTTPEEYPKRPKPPIDILAPMETRAIVRMHPYLLDTHS